MYENIPNDTADIYIYGDITSTQYEENDTSGYSFQKQFNESTAKNVNVYINSFGGDVSEGMAIYNTLKNSDRNITTYCDGFACSIASLIFMAGEKRVMSNQSLLFLHNPWTIAMGNSKELKKEADNLDKIKSVLVNAYVTYALDENDVNFLLDEETWLTPMEAYGYGLATEIGDYEDTYYNSARDIVFDKLIDKHDDYFDMFIKQYSAGLNDLIDKTEVAMEKLAKLNTNLTDTIDNVSVENTQENKVDTDSNSADTVENNKSILQKFKEFMEVK